MWQLSRNYLLSFHELSYVYVFTIFFISDRPTLVATALLGANLLHCSHMHSAKTLRQEPHFCLWV